MHHKVPYTSGSDGLITFGVVYLADKCPVNTGTRPDHQEMQERREDLDQLPEGHELCVLFPLLRPGNVFNLDEECPWVSPALFLVRLVDEPHLEYCSAKPKNNDCPLFCLLHVLEQHRLCCAVACLHGQFPARG